MPEAEPPPGRAGEAGTLRVLWLSNTPAAGAGLLGVPKTLVHGWVAALEEALAGSPEIDLHVAFPWREAEVRVLGGERSTSYAFPRYPRGGRLRQALFDHSTRLVPETELRHLERVIELSRPDLVHVWGTESFLGLVAERCRPPVLFEIQGPRTPYLEVYLSGLSQGDLLRYGSPRRLAAGTSLWHRYHRYRLSARRERRMLATARFVSGRTRWDRQVSATLAPAARYFHCDRVLRPPFYAASWERREPDGELRLATTVRGNAYKGIETVWRSAELLRSLWPGELRWTLVGIRENEEIVRIVERKLGRSAAELGVRPVGRQRPGEVVDRLLASDLYVHPSRIENSPNGLCEAMLLGLPIVATGVGGVPSLVADGEEGLLVPAGDPWAMAGAILELARDPDLAGRLAAAARRRALDRHDPQTIARALVGIYREIVSAAAAPGAGVTPG